MDIREAIHQRLKNTSDNELYTLFKESIHSEDEAVLPGLGVLFEDYYLYIDASKQKEFCKHLANLLK